MSTKKYGNVKLAKKRCSCDNPKWDSTAVAVVSCVASDTMVRKQEFSNTEPLKHEFEMTSLILDTKKWLGIFLS